MECKLENITVYYEIFGEGYPILTIHGWPVDHRIMKGCMEPIFETRPNYKRIYFDQPGMGKTKGEDWIKGTDDYLKIIMIFLEKVRENYAFSFNVDLSNEKFDKPALFLLGRQDSNVGYRDAWEIIENYPRATFAILDTAGHILQIEQEELFNALTNDWLDRVESFLKKSI